jgi:hypothetical protein
MKVPKVCQVHGTYRRGVTVPPPCAPLDTNEGEAGESAAGAAGVCIGSVS